MIIDLTKLISGLEDEIIIDEKLSFKEEDLKDTNLLDLKNVLVKGTICNGELDNYNLNLDISGVMILPCSRTLKPTEYHFNIEIDENIDENYKKHQKSIDIFPIIWENILMEIPIKIINPEAENMEIKGDGWELITDSEN